MKKKYYILIAIATTAVVFFGIPFCYYHKGRKITINPNKIPNGTVYFPLEVYSKENKTSLSEYISKYWQSILAELPSPNSRT